MYQGPVTRSEGLRHGFKVEKSGQYLKEVDKIRNYFIDHFETDDGADTWHLKYWIPLETVTESCDQLEEEFELFLKAKAKAELKYKDHKFFESFVEWMSNEYNDG